MARLLFRAHATVSNTPGTGSFTLSTAAFTDTLAWSTAGAEDGHQYAYLAIEGTSWEAGEGTYTSGTLTRDKILKSSNSDNAVTFTSAVTVASTPGPTHLQSRGRILALSNRIPLF